LQSVHGCIGVVGPLKIFGSPALKERLRSLASGTAMSAFALTEPGAGSDLSAVKTTARRVGDNYVINGEKVFITNSYYGRMICVVAKVEGE
ncbi:acyl-CoA dehydrogenase family protein, partial [Acinetobacter baumannii]